MLFKLIPKFHVKEAKIKLKKVFLVGEIENISSETPIKKKQNDKLIKK